MDKIVHPVIRRVYLVERLPDPLTPASSHLQIFDRYIAGTRLRIRSIRDPYDGSWTRILQQPAVSPDQVGIHLNAAEHNIFKHLPGTEVRKNRYFHEFDNRSFAFDIYLGDLLGLKTAKVGFETTEDLGHFIPPRFTLYDVTDNAFFEGASLATKSVADIDREIARLAAGVQLEDLNEAE